MQKSYILLFLGMTWFLSSCTIYKIDVRQGNLVTQEMLDQLELEMSTQKVQLIMGTPLIVDVFHQHRWDYLYSFQPGGSQREQRHISLYFDDSQRLQRVEGDVKIGKPRPPKPAPLPDFDQEPIL